MFVLLDCMIFSFHLRWTKNVYQSVCYLPHVWCIHIRCDITWTNSCALVRANPGPKGNVLIGENTVSFPYIRCTQLTCRWYWRYCISERFFRQQWTGMPVHGTAPVRHRSTEIAIWKMELKHSIIHSKYFPDSDWLKAYAWFIITSYWWPNFEEFWH